MKRFVVRFFIFLFIIAVCDIIIGKAMHTVCNNLTSGGQGRDNYICNEADEDIMIFGSSRAYGHYNSSIIEDSIGLSTYNCGAVGNGIILAYGRLKMIKQRYNPKIIIYDIYPEADFYVGDNKKSIGNLRFFSDKDYIAQIINDVDPLEKYKMVSGMYRNNSIFLQNLYFYVTSAPSKNIKGYRPNYGEMDKIKVAVEENINQKGDVEIDTLKMRLFNLFIKECECAQLFFVLSPLWSGMNQKEVKMVESFCSSHDLPLLNFANNPKYVHHDEYFIDGLHLNSKGADVFTKDFVALIRDSIKSVSTSYY